MFETLAAFNSIEMLGGYAFTPPVGASSYKRVKERRPMRTKGGWSTILPYSDDNWYTLFETVSHRE